MKEVEQFFVATKGRYLDVDNWAKINGISKQEARKQLQLGVQLGHLEECLMYEWPDSPVRFVVPEAYLGRSVRLADVGYIGEDDQDEVVISEFRTRKVFVSARGAA